jgi:hypothetical protein
MTDHNQSHGMKRDWTFYAACAVAFVYIATWALLLWEFGFGGTPPFSAAGGNWERAIAMFNALSAIAGAAFGVLLGTKVQQVKVEMLRSSTIATNNAANAYLATQPEDNAAGGAQGQLRNAVARADAVLKVI